MEFEDCVKFANENPLSWVATTDGDQPRVRGLGLWFADETGFYFQIGLKDVYKQLQKNSKVEIAFFKPGELFGTMMRVAGEVEFLDDLELKKKVLEDRPFLKKWGVTPEDPKLIVFRVPKGKAYFWTITSDAEPKKMIKFGSGE